MTGSEQMPEVGEVWYWQPLLPWASQRVTVSAVERRGGEWWVQAETPDGKRYWNELDRWIEATVLVES